MAFRKHDSSFASEWVRDTPLFSVTASGCFRAPWGWLPDGGSMSLPKIDFLMSIKAYLWPMYDPIVTIA